MYTVKARIKNGSSYEHVIIHDNNLPSAEVHLIDPKLKIADTSAGTFTATLMPDNPGYSLIERFNTPIDVYKEGTQIWSGRVLTESVDFWNRRSISCEGALAYLNDTVQPIHYFGNNYTPASILSALLSIHNNKVDSVRKIYVGSVDDFFEYEYNGYTFQTDNGTTWEELKYHILDRFECHLTVRYSNGNTYIDLFRDYPNTSPQTIDFGVNLLDFTRNWNLIDLCTVILPRGSEIDADTAEGQKTYVTLKTENEESIPIEDGYYGGSDQDPTLQVSGTYMINLSLYNRYGRIEKVINFNDCDTASQLFNLARYYVMCMQFDELVLKVSAVDLHMLTKSNVSFNLLDEVYCTSLPHGMYGQYFPISEIDIPLDKPENTTYTMTRSSVNTGFTTSFNSFQSGIATSFKSIASTGHILNLAKAEASTIINRKTTGYVSVVNMYDNEEEGNAQAIVISNNPEWKKAGRYWIWNMNGLAYYNGTRSSEIEASIGTPTQYEYAERDGYNFETPRYYDMAITMDGTIVANHIKAGILSDGMGYNYWNLETGEFSLQPNTRLQYGGPSDYTSVHDLIYGVDKAGKKKSGAENYLDGAKDWGGWTYSSGWELIGEEFINTSSYSSNFIHSKNKSIPYLTVKGYTMTFSIEGCLETDSSWGELRADNSVIITFGLWRPYIQEDSNLKNRVAHIDRLFSFDNNYTRRYTTVNFITNEFTVVDDDWKEDEVYVRITISNASNHRISIRRPKLEHGNTPTDWSTSEPDIDKEADNKATTAYNASIVVAKSYAKQAQSNSISAAESLSENALSKSKKYTSEISDNDRKYSDGVLNAFQTELYHEEILRRLTNDYEDDIFRMYDGHIYMNATRLRSGSIDVGLLTAGVIHDQLDNNKWDLTSGYFESRNGVFKNIQASGSLDVGRSNGSRFLIKDGSIMGYWNDRYVGSITVASLGTPHGEEQSIVIKTPILYINSDRILVKASNGNWYDTHSKESIVKTTYVKSIRDNGNGTISWTTGELYLNFEKGFFSGGYAN